MIANAEYLSSPPGAVGRIRRLRLGAALWATAVLKLAAAGLAFALARRPRWLPRWVLQVAGWSAAALLSLYGLSNLVQHLLIATGVLAVPAGLGEAALPWHLLLWDPVWIVGGVLFTLAALGYSAPHTRTTGDTRR